MTRHYLAGNFNVIVCFQNYSTRFLRSFTSKVPVGLNQNILNIGLTKPEQLKALSNAVQSNACDSTKADEKQERKTNSGIRDTSSKYSQISVCSSETA